jgi:hypothetical protein
VNRRYLSTGGRGIGLKNAQPSTSNTELRKQHSELNIGRSDVQRSMFSA